MAVFQFLKDSLSEPSGNASFSRISAGVIIAAVIVWVSYLVFKTNTMPDLAGPTLFLTGGAGATYGTNKIVTAFENNTPQQNQNPPSNPTSPTASPTVPTQVGN